MRPQASVATLPPLEVASTSSVWMTTLGSIARNQQLATKLGRLYTGIRGFERRNLFRIRQFYEAYRANTKVSLLVRLLPWTHHLIILSQAKPVETTASSARTAHHPATSMGRRRHRRIRRSNPPSNCTPRFPAQQKLAPTHAPGPTQAPVPEHAPAPAPEHAPAPTHAAGPTQAPAPTPEHAPAPTHAPGPERAGALLRTEAESFVRLFILAACSAAARPSRPRHPHSLRELPGAPAPVGRRRFAPPPSSPRCAAAGGSGCLRAVAALPRALRRPARAAGWLGLPEPTGTSF